MNFINRNNLFTLLLYIKSIYGLPVKTRKKARRKISHDKSIKYIANNL